MMKITRKSLISGKERSLELNITEEQIKEWEEGKVAMKAFPDISDEEREFFLTGCTEEDWNI